MSTHAAQNRLPIRYQVSTTSQFYTIERMPSKDELERSPSAWATMRVIFFAYMVSLVIAIVLTMIAPRTLNHEQRAANSHVNAAVVATTAKPGNLWRPSDEPAIGSRSNPATAP